LSNTAQAHTGSGGNCAACHGSAKSDAAQILAPKTYQGLPMFEVTAGNTVDLTEVTHPTTDPFAVALGGQITNIPVVTDNPPTRYSTISLVSGNVSGSVDGTHKLIFTTDAAWTTKGTTHPNWYTVGPFNSGTATDQTSIYHMAVDASTPEDYYPLTFTTAGGAEDWADPEAFYLHVLAPVPEPSTFALFGLATIGLLIWRRKRVS
jgi:hypothetical protein